MQKKVTIIIVRNMENNTVINHIRMGCLQKTKKELYTHSFCEKTLEFKSVFLPHQKTHTRDILIPSFIYQNKTILEYDTTDDLRDETISQNQPYTSNHISEYITPDDEDLMVPI